MLHTSSRTSQIVTIPYIPDLTNPGFLDVLLPAKDDKMYSVAIAKDEVPQNEMMAALHKTKHQAVTDNGAMAYHSTGSSLLDAFQGLTRKTFGVSVDNYLEAAWKEDPALTLKIIWSLRSIHNGKGEREIFYRAFGWLLKHHPRTAIANLKYIVEPVCTRAKVKTEDAELDSQPHGYYKDLITILALRTVDQLSTIDKEPTFLHASKIRKSKHTLQETKEKTSRKRRVRLSTDEPKKTEKIQRSEEEISAARERHLAGQKLAQERKNEMRKEAVSQAHDRIMNHFNIPAYTALYIAVARLFADRLSEDIKILKESQKIPPGTERAALLKKISLAGKWAPTPQNSHDSQTNISTAIAILLHQAQVLDSSIVTSSPASGSAYSASECHILRTLYQRQVLTPLRRVTKIAEPLMSSGKWKEIHYGRVPAVSMKLNSELFYKHDPEGFEAYMDDVEMGKKTISGATLWPHEIVGAAMIASANVIRGDDSGEQAGKTSVKTLKSRLASKLAESQIRVLEQQWKALVARLKESGKLDSAIAVCDVSGSMGVIDGNYKDFVSPVLPAVALSLVLARLAVPPFADSIITFSANPSFHALDPSQGLVATVRNMMSASWGMNTDLEAVFLKLILPLAIKEKVPPDQMIKRVFIFSDMHFDEGCSGTSVSHGEPTNGQADQEPIPFNPSNWATTHDAIEKAYKQAGYEVPQIVYWDLSHDTGRFVTPVSADRKGTALMSGFSPALLKVFMGDNADEEETVEDEWQEVNGKGEAKPIAKDAENLDPLGVMKKVLSVKSFQKLQVWD